MVLRAPDAGDDRAASEVVAVALLIGVVLLGVTAVVVIGGPRLDAARSSAEVGQAERALTQFDSDVERVVMGGTTAQRVDLGLRANEGTLDVRNDSGRITVEYVYFPNGTSVEVANTSMGAVVYENGDTSVAYQGGGVWRSDGTGSTVVSPPEISLRRKTLVVPVVETTSRGSVYSAVQATRAWSEERFPDPAANLTNEVSGAKIRITVRSRYYRAWGAFFEEETGAVVRYDRDARTVTVVFSSPNTGPSAFPSGIIATNGNGYLELAGKGAYSDSYESSEGPYTSPGDENGTIVAVGDVRTTGNSTVYGDVWSGSTVTLDGETSVYGDVYWTDDYEQNGAAVSGNDTEIAGLAAINPIDSYVDGRVDSIESSNDNDETGNITDEAISISDDGDGDLPSGTLTAGRYYVDRLNLTGERLVLDTTDGNVSLAVGEYVLLRRGGQGDPGSNITVKGDGVVRLYVASEEKILIEKSGQNNLDRDRNLSMYVSIDSKVYVPDNRAPQLRVFGPREFTMAMAGSDSKPTYFNGYVYAPAGRHGSGDAYLKQGEVYGGIVTGNLTIGQYAAVHYDRTLANRTIPRSPAAARIEYLYVSVNRVNVSGT
ncbi:MAG: hypothetical protein ABEH47_07325 [Haloferacaceae archaeon]